MKGLVLFFFQEESRKVSLLNLMKYGGISKDSFVGGNLVSQIIIRKKLGIGKDYLLGGKSERFPNSCKEIVSFW